MHLCLALFETLFVDSLFREWSVSLMLLQQKDISTFLLNYNEPTLIVIIVQNGDLLKLTIYNIQKLPPANSCYCMP